MKVSGFWVLVFLLGTALMLLNFSSNKTSSSIPVKKFITSHGWLNWTGWPICDFNFVGDNPRMLEKCMQGGKLNRMHISFARPEEAQTFLLANTVPFETVASDMFAQHNGGMAMTTASRRLKQTGYNPTTNKKHNVGMVNLEDYHPINPVPSSKTSIRHGPIEHGSPLIPYIPRHSPPGGPRNGGST